MMNSSSLPAWELIAIVFVVAFLYSSVGFGGASGYLAAMSLFALSPDLMASTALILNILVASIAFVAYGRAGYFQPRLLLPFLLTSVPMAFLGGFMEVEDLLYRALLYIALTYVGIRLLFVNGPIAPAVETRNRYLWFWFLASGALIGLLSGILGLGGGIFLSPLIVLSGWGTPKEAAASSAGFIVVNSISTILGRLFGDNFVFGVFGAVLLPIGLAGALGGSRLGVRYLSGAALRRVLGAVLLLAVIHYFLF